MTKCRTNKRQTKSGRPPVPHERPRRNLLQVLLFAILLFVAILTAYWTSFQGAFVFDDPVHIAANPRIQEIWPLWHTLSGRRPIVDLSLAINFQFGGLEPWGYHLWNMLVHFAAALTLFGVLHRLATVGTAGNGRRTSPGRGPFWLSATVALVWAVHPLQTQAVTYVIQRGESMMALFYLLALYCFLRGTTGHQAKGWYALSLSCSALAMGCKAVAVSIPAALMLMDYCFISVSWRDVILKRRLMYLAVVAVVAGVAIVTGVAGGVLSFAPRPNTSVGFAFQGISPLEYAMTMPGAVVYYLRLALWPHPLCFDYAWPVADSMSAVAWPALLIALVVAGIAILFRTKRRLALAGALPLVILLPTTSIIPFRDPLVEHRMYLPLAGIIVLLVFSAKYLLSRATPDREASRRRHRYIQAALVASVVLVLVVATARRNLVYKSNETLWRDVVAKRPNNARAHLNLGAELANSSLSGAMAAFRRALEIDPQYADAYFNLARGLEVLGKRHSAIGAYRKAVTHNPRLAGAYNNLGRLLDLQGKPDEAVDSYRGAVKADKQHVRSRINLGNALVELGKTDEALQWLEEAAQIEPDLIEARASLTRLHLRMDNLDGALREVAFMAALAVRGAAVTDMRRSVTLTRQLANRLAQQKRYAPAARVYRMLLRQDDSNPRDAHNLAFVLHSDGKSAEAIQLIEALLVRHPDFLPAQDALTVLSGQSSH